VASEIRTARLILWPATLEALHAELDSREAFAQALRAEVPATWPPEFYDADAVRWTMAWLERNADQREWGFYYIIESPQTTGGTPRLAGAGGYKGAPDAAGSVEVGYSVVADRRRRGYAREAVAALLAHAFADPRVTHVVAHTLEELAASIGVLRSTGFEFVGKGSDPYEPDAIRFEMTRARYENQTSTSTAAPERAERADLTT
jgi:[ribosomal protein S5]-alanine N-acetyltransferase